MYSEFQKSKGSQKLDVSRFRHIVGEYFKRYGYVVESNKVLRGNSGILHRIDVFAYDKNFEEIKIACRCGVQSDPVDESQVMLWAKVCEDIHAAPAYASTSAYTGSALEAARRLNFILLTYDQQSDVISKIEARKITSAEEGTKQELVEAEQILQEVTVLREQLVELFEQKPRPFKEISELINKIEQSLSEAITSYRQLLKEKEDKRMWLKLAEMYHSLVDPCYCKIELEDDLKKKHLLEKQMDEYLEESYKCLINALAKHLNEFPEPLTKLSIRSSTLKRIFSELLGINLSDFIIEMFQIALIKAYLRDHSDDVDMWLRLAGFYESLMHYKTIEELSPNPIIIRLKAKENASKCYEKALEINPERAVGHAAHFYERIGEIDKAIELYKKYCELRPDYPYPCRALAEIYERMSWRKSDPEEVAECLKEAIRYMEEHLKRVSLEGILKPSWQSLQKLGNLYHRLGKYYREKGDEDKASEYLGKALEMFRKSLE